MDWNCTRGGQSEAQGQRGPTVHSHSSARGLPARSRTTFPDGAFLRGCGEFSPLPERRQPQELGESLPHIRNHLHQPPAVPLEEGVQMYKGKLCLLLGLSYYSLELNKDFLEFSP